MAQLPLLGASMPKGSGPVLVILGFMADDSATWLLRRFLDRLGYAALPWALGMNRGAMLSYLPALLARLEAVRAEQRMPVALVGWSRGGVLARELARERPDLIRSVITLGSPVRGGLSGVSIGPWIAREAGLTPEQINGVLTARETRPIVVPVTAIYSRTDGVVAWRACVDTATRDVRHVEVDGSHVGLVVNADVYRAVARALAPDQESPD